MGFMDKFKETAKQAGEGAKRMGEAAKEGSDPRNISASRDVNRLGSEGVATKAILKSLTAQGGKKLGGGTEDVAEVEVGGEIYYRVRVGPFSDGIAAAAALAEGTEAGGLVWPEDGEAEAVLRHNVQRFQVDGGLREPHALRLPAEPMDEVGLAPQDLRPFVAPVREGEDGVVVGLCHSRAVITEVGHRSPIGGDDRLIRARPMIL